MILAIGFVAQPLSGFTIQPVGAEAAKHEQAFAATKKLASKSKTSEKSETVSSEIEETLKSQADAWNAGDLDKFMTAYLKSPDISFVSADGEMKGYEALGAIPEEVWHQPRHHGQVIVFRIGNPIARRQERAMYRALVGRT